ncbi:MAG TPA: YciI-like protein [Bacteroidota bacterium]|nr:YciI-like protein [Bacteroidota bacterium]
MNYYALIYDLVPDYLQRRGQVRDVHLKLAEEYHQRGELLLAGAFTEPTDRALLVFRTSGVGPIEEFIRKDPYVKNKLVAKWEIRPWTVVIGK